MKYVADAMLNGLAKELPKRGEISCTTALNEVWKERDSSKPGKYDAKIFRFFLEKNYKLTPLEDPEKYMLITADKDLARYFEEFGLNYRLARKPESRQAFKTMADRLATEILSGQLERSVEETSE